MTEFKESREQYEASCYRKFDHCIVVTSDDKRDIELTSHLTNTSVVPNRTDTSYFKPIHVQEDVHSLTFVGAMRSPEIVKALRSFYFDVFSSIVKECPNIRFRITEADASATIRNLAVDEKVVVTGFVEDVRSHPADTSIVVVPKLSASGIKNKVLEAMAGKPVVTTPVEAQGIEVTHGTNILVANNAREFVSCVLSLLSIEPLRKKMGSNARKLIERQYSWITPQTC